MGCSSSKGAAKVGPQGSYSQVPADSPISGLLANADADAIENGDAAKENSSPVPAKLEKQPEAKPSSPPKAEDLEEAPGSARDLLVPQKSMQKGPPWGRFAALWVCCTLASGILPGQSLFASLASKWATGWLRIQP
ncbi:unnamed protein product [Effrenium voratum]|nr:unnamed protein product [Effrenium voratum]